MKFPKCAWCRLPIDFGSTSLLQWLLLEAGLLLTTKIVLSQLWELLSVLLLASGLGVTLVDFALTLP